MSRFALLLPLLAAFLLASCGRDEPVRVYEVVVPPHAGPPEQPSPAGGNPPPPTPAPPTPAAANLVWDVPDGWDEQPLTNLINRGHYRLPGDGDDRAVLTISAYPGAAGGVGPNLARWQRQLGLAGSPPPEPASMTTPAGEATVVQIVGTSDGSPSSIRGAVLPRSGDTWFFKLTGPPEAVDAGSSAFDALLQSLRPESAAPAAPAPDVEATTVPTGWVEQEATGMRRASFRVPGPDGFDADISVVRLAGDGGGPLANVNLWRQQLGLDPVEDEKAALDQQSLGGRSYLIFDATGTAPPEGRDAPGRIIAALTRSGDALWVVRMRGHATHVGAEKPRFLELLAGLKLP